MPYALKHYQQDRFNRELQHALFQDADSLFRAAGRDSLGVLHWVKGGAPTKAMGPF